MKYCKECLYPSVSVLLNIHDDGICLVVDLINLF